MNDDNIVIRVRNKLHVFSRTENHWFDITDCLPDSNGVLWKAGLVSDECVADLYSKSLKGKASTVRRLGKEKAVNLVDSLNRDPSGGPVI